LENGRQYFTPDAPGDVYLPLEFAGAAYRYGHSQIRQAYVVNDESSEQRFYGPPDEALGFGFQPVCPEDTVEWKYFFDLEDGTSPQPARKIDPLIRPVLLDLPFFDGKFTSLATRNLLRGHVLQLPSGQDVAEEIGATQLSNEQIGLKEPIERIYDDIDASPPEEAGAPLWYYVLGEAQHEQDGDKLGPVGSRVVAETLVALLEADPTSYRNRTDWAPTLVASETDTPIGDFRIQDILAEGPLLFESDLDLDRSVVIQGTGGDMGTRYTVEVSDTLAQATGSIGGIPVTDNPDETVTKSRADGRVAGGADGYRFTGDIAGFSLTDHSEATVYVDEEEVDSRQIPGRNPIPRTLIIEGSGEYTEYSFMTSRGLRQVEGLLEGKAVTKDESDTVDGLTASGAVVGGADGFRFGGEIIDFSIDQPDKVTIYVDGQVRDVETLPSKDLPRTLVLESDPSRPDAGYTVSVSGVIKQAEGSVDGIPVSKDPNDTVESPNADGYVAAGADGFRFTGEITEFSLDDPDAATVYVDGKPRDLDHLPAQVTASFDANPPDPAPNEAVTFDGGSSKAPFGEIVTHEWEIRRGELGEGEIVESGIGELLSTRLEEPGTYTVRLFVTGEDGSTASTAHRLQIEPEPDAPTARIEWRNEPVQVGERISFSAAPSTDPDGDIVDRVWMVSHQGESIARATGETFAFEFDTPGDYTVRLQVNDDDARQDTTSIEVTVNP
jgi:hypothetical protein